MSNTQTCRDISELTPNAQTACKLFLSECKAQGLNVLITETYRSQARQNYLYEQGRSRSGKIVTWTKNSRHTSRRAWDICKNKKGEEYSDASFFKKCGIIAAKLGITWGGTWKTPDTPHFEISENWKKPKGADEEMTNEEKIKFDALMRAVETLSSEVKALKESMPKIYHYGTDIPEWGRVALFKAQQKGIFKGASESDLNISEDVLKNFVYMERLGLI